MGDGSLLPSSGQERAVRFDLDMNEGSGSNPTHQTNGNGSSLNGSVYPNGNGSGNGECAVPWARVLPSKDAKTLL